MRWPLMLRSVAEVQVAGLQAVIETKDQTAAMYRQRYEDASSDAARLVQEKMDLKETVRSLQARLDALTPARDPVTKRFVGKAVSNG